MSQISPPIRILLVCAVAFVAAWMLLLRPKADAEPPVAAAPVTAADPVAAGGAKAQTGAGQAVEKANEAAGQSGPQSEKRTGGARAETGGTRTARPGAGVVPAAGSEPATKVVAAGLPARVVRALEARKVVVLLFWKPSAAEDADVRASLTHIDRHDGRVLAQAVHVKRIAAFQQITRGANVDQSPSIVVIDRDRKVETLVGFVDRITIDQAVTDALRRSKA